GERQAAGAAVKETHAEAILDRVDMAGHHGLRHAEGSGRRREAAERRDPRQDLHSGEPIEHRISRSELEMIPRMTGLSQRMAERIYRGIPARRGLAPARRERRAALPLAPGDGGPSRAMMKLAGECSPKETPMAETTTLDRDKVAEFLAR